MRTFVIAEAGVNHNGDIETALEMVRRAARTGARAIKFQTFRAEDLVTGYAPKAEYQKRTDSAPSQFEMLKRLELDDGDFALLAEECRRLGIEFMSTPFSIPAARLLGRLGMKTWKIPSGEITNLPLLEFVASQPGTVILSTGMATLDEVRAALDIVRSKGKEADEIYLLHCTTAYPTPVGDVNLRAMDTLAALPGIAGVGYSDHTAGTAVAVAAVARGAVIIEKHFTLDPEMDGPDQKTSLTPDLFEKMVRDIAEAEAALGSAVKQPSPSERANMAVARKSIVAARDIAAGETFSEDNLTAKRPGDGLSPLCWHELIGRKARRPYQADGQILADELPQPANPQ